MFGIETRSIARVVFIGAIVYEWLLKDFLFTNLGIWREMQPIFQFPYECRRVEDARLEGCEDMWLDDEARVLYAACAGSLSRASWTQSMGYLNATGRRPSGSDLIALQIDKPGTDGLYGLTPIQAHGYKGALGDGALDLLGFDAEAIDAQTLRFWLINHRPPVDVDGKLLDGQTHGANVTVEVFDLKRGKKEMAHVKTVSDPQIWAGNNIAAVGGGAFVLTNDRSNKVGFRKELDLVLGGGNVAYCPQNGPCKPATTTRFRFPNGLVRNPQTGLIYVPSAFADSLTVNQLQSDGTLKVIEKLHVGMPIDNLAVDAKGDIYAAGLASTTTMMQAFHDPFNVRVPSTVWRIRKLAQGGHEAEKVVEDRLGHVLSGVTVARHDAKTGRIFMGGAVTPFMMVCEPKLGSSQPSL